MSVIEEDTGSPKTTQDRISSLSCWCLNIEYKRWSSEQDKLDNERTNQGKLFESLSLTVIWSDLLWRHSQGDLALKNRGSAITRGASKTRLIFLSGCFLPRLIWNHPLVISQCWLIWHRWDFYRTTLRALLISPPGVPETAPLNPAPTGRKRSVIFTVGRK